jgi:predicted esterase YcpF (UPF0227 family)
MRRKKDAELYKIEEEKIKDKNEEVLRGIYQKDQLAAKAKQIEDRVKSMKQFEDFLEKVKEKHSDEFQEINDILQRH